MIAGLEPTETNLLFQAIAEGADKKIDPQVSAPKKASTKPTTKASPREKKEETTKKKTAIKTSTSTGNLNKKVDAVKISPRTTSRQPTTKKTKTEKSKPESSKSTPSLTSNTEKTKEIETNDELKLPENKIDEGQLVEKQHQESIVEKIDEARSEDKPREFNENRVNDKIEEKNVDPVISELTLGKQNKENPENICKYLLKCYLKQLK